MLSKEVNFMTDKPIEYDSAMHKLIAEQQEDNLGHTIAGVLEFLTARSVVDAPYYITTDDKSAVAVFAANEDAKGLLAILPDTYKSWEEEMSEPEFLTDTDPGDEQGDEAE
jgi:hypothetical protein